MMLNIQEYVFKMYQYHWQMIRYQNIAGNCIDKSVIYIDLQILMLKKQKYYSTTEYTKDFYHKGL